MLFDRNPPYPHYDHLPYAKEPWKSLYVFQRLFTTLALVPVWVLYYLLMPRSHRPRVSWNLRQIVNVNFTRRIYKVTEVAGVTWGTRDPTIAPEQHSLKETRFEWADPLPNDYRTGILRDSPVAFTSVGCYVWPKNIPPSLQHLLSWKATSMLGDSTGVASALSRGSPSTEPLPTVGIFMHGGGYCHMSAHESSRTSRIPRKLVKDKRLDAIYSVEYRLLQHAPFPAVIQDAATVYSSVVQTFGHGKCKFILIGDSSGGSLVLALTRWIRDEGRLPMPDGLLLLSPSCDTTSALPATLSSYIPRPNRYTDYLVDTPEPRALLQRTFLGCNGRGPSTPEEERRLMEIVHSEYVSPCSPVVLRRWGHETKQDPEGIYENNFIRSIFKRLPSALRLGRPLPELGQVRTTAVEVASLDSRQAQIPPDTPSVESIERGSILDPEINAGPLTSLPATSVLAAVTTTVPSIQTAQPCFSYPQPSRQFPTLFHLFPRTLVVCGDAERLVREVRSLINAMEQDGVDLDVCWAPDACHDVLIINEWWWDRRVLNKIWDQVGTWVQDFRFDKSESESSADDPETLGPVSR